MSLRCREALFGCLTGVLIVEHPPNLFPHTLDVHLYTAVGFALAFEDDEDELFFWTSPLWSCVCCPEPLGRWLVEGTAFLRTTSLAASASRQNASSSCCLRRHTWSTSVVHMHACMHVCYNTTGITTTTVFFLCVVLQQLVMHAHPCVCVCVCVCVCHVVGVGMCVTWQHRVHLCGVCALCTHVQTCVVCANTFVVRANTFIRYVQTCVWGGWFINTNLD